MRKSNESGKCTGKSDKTANTESCAKYYDCRDAIPASGEPKLKECPFPYLFDEKLQECLHFSQVDCGTRYEPKDACKYGFFKESTKHIKIEWNMITCTYSMTNFLHLPEDYKL